MQSSVAMKTFEPGHIFKCERKGCGVLASTIINTDCGDGDILTFFTCEEHKSEFLKIRKASLDLLEKLHDEKVFSFNNPILAELKGFVDELERLSALGEKLKKSEPLRKKKKSVSEDERLGGR